MIGVIEGILRESVVLLNAMSPYLLFGFLFAGVLHVFVSLDMISRHLGRSNIGSVLKSVILGIPLPLCSCGVIPAAVSLRRKGAGRGAVVSFLIATPITGIDSIFATYSLMGFFFAVYRLIASALAAVVSGILTNLLIKDETPTVHNNNDDGGNKNHNRCHHCSEAAEKGRPGFGEFFHYAFFELLGDIWKWLLLGVVIGGAISYLTPDAFISTHLNSSWKSMLAMLVIGIPMYVCATGSIPIATSLMLKGMSPGAALVFLLAGPATNAVTITVVARELGKATAALYIGSIAVTSVVLGLLLDLIWLHLGAYIGYALKPAAMLPHYVGVVSSIVLGLLILYNIMKAIAGYQKNH